jgi:hypothetical protein
MQDDPLEQFPERQVEVLGETLEHLEQVSLDPDARLDAFSCYHGTTVPFAPRHLEAELY